MSEKQHDKKFDKYEQYARLDSEIKDLTAQRDKIKPLIVEELYKQGSSSMACGFGKFSIVNLKTWKYTEAVEEKTEELKALKAQEESRGEATYEEKPSLRFTGAKF